VKAIDSIFKSRYPALYDFLDSFYWLKEDGANLLKLLYQVFLRAHPERAKAMVTEFQKLAQDRDINDDDIVDLFMRGTRSPYRIINVANARDVLFCLGEFLASILKESSSGIRRTT
jgi:hypothetical protein